MKQQNSDAARICFLRDMKKGQEKGMGDNKQ